MTIENNAVHADNGVIHVRFKRGFANFFLDVDCSIPGQGITAIFGESGSGKTSLLRCIAGLEKAPQGKLIVNGDVWQGSSQFLPTHKRPLGYVFQESSLFAHLSAKGNLDFALKRSKNGYNKELYDKVIAVMGIDAILPKMPDNLSGGERQRVAIARALLIQPRLLLMDEPLASLDERRKQEILPYLEKMRTTFEMPIIYVSHSMDEIARLADHAVLLEQGQIVAQGELTEVFSHIDLPMRLGNETGVILKGKVVEVDQKWHLAKISLNEQTILLPDNDFKTDQTVRIRILAKDISLALTVNQDSSILNKLQATIVDISEDCQSAMSLVRLQFGSDYLIARITRKSLHQLELSKGKQVWAQVKSVAVVK